jgi:hypothetical protein
MTKVCGIDRVKQKFLGRSRHEGLSELPSVWAYNFVIFCGELYAFLYFMKRIGQATAAVVPTLYAAEIGNDYEKSRNRYG